MSGCRYTNFDMATGLSAHIAIPIMHLAARFPAFHRKEMGSVDLKSDICKCSVYVCCPVTKHQSIIWRWRTVMFVVMMQIYNQKKKNVKYGKCFTILTIIQKAQKPSIHPSIHSWSAAHPGSGCGGSSFSRRPQTSTSGSSDGDLRRSQASGEI